jgi:hypothetical protein
LWPEEKDIGTDTRIFFGRIGEKVKREKGFYALFLLATGHFPLFEADAEAAEDFSLPIND